MTHVRSYTSQRFFYSLEAAGAKWEKVRDGLATSNGASDGSTVIDTNSDSGTANTYVGNYWIRMTTGTCEGERQRIVEDTGAGTYTLEEPFSAQIDSGDRFELWSSPESVAVCASSNLATTTFEDQGRNEADDTWVDYYAYVLHSATINLGLWRKVTDFVLSTNVFTTDAFPTAHLEGDVILLVKAIDIEATTPGLAQAFHPRPGQRDNFSKGKGTVGARSGTFAFNSDVYSSESLAGNGVKAKAGVLSGLFPACGFDETVDTTSTIIAGSSTTAINVTDQQENHTIGGFVLINGQVRVVTDKEDNAGTDVVTVAPPLQVAPANGDLMYALRSYRRSPSGDIPSVTLYLDIDNIRHVMTGCKGSVSFTDGAPPQLAWSFNIDEWIRQIITAPTAGQAVYTTSSAVLSDNMRFYLDTTATSVAGLTCALNPTIVPRDVRGAHGINGRNGFQMTGSDPGGSFRELIASDATALIAENRFLRGTSTALTAILGGGTQWFAIRAPAAVVEELPQTSNENGMAGAPQVWRAKDAGSVAWDSDNGGNDDTVTKMPDLVWGLS